MEEILLKKRKKKSIIHANNLKDKIKQRGVSGFAKLVIFLISVIEKEEDPWAGFQARRKLRKNNKKGQEGWIKIEKEC